MYSLSLTPFVYHIIHKSAIAYLNKMKILEILSMSRER